MARSTPQRGQQTTQGGRNRPYVDPKRSKARGSSKRVPPVMRKKGGGFWGFLSFLASTVIVLGALVLVAGFAFVAEATRPGPSPHPATFIVEHGASVSAIADGLVMGGEVRNALVFRIASRAYSEGKSLRAGEYAIPAQASMKDIVTRMAEGRVVQHNVTIPEGYTSAQVMDVLAHADLLTGPIPAVPPEGSVLPETYGYERGLDRTALLHQMMAARVSALAQIWAHRAPNLPITTPEQAVTLASIVEKETGLPSERPRVAAVFTNRLRIGMALQSDPTIIYGVCMHEPAQCKNGRLINERTGEPRVIRESEINMNTGYNTYKIAGLPPGPIANPGRASLEAVVNPAPTSDLYFVADGTGGHAFASNVADHERNVAHWREIEHQRLQEEAAHAPPAPAPPAHAPPARSAARRH